jgi:hypothetical protein
MNGDRHPSGDGKLIASLGRASTVLTVPRQSGPFGNTHQSPLNNGHSASANNGTCQAAAAFAGDGL